MKVTYLLHLWVVLVLTIVRSRPHHLRHQWPQISTFISLNHIRHHTYFKSSYVHIQVFHILHHHTMKLLLAFKSFLPRPIVEFGSENSFAAGCPIRQRKLVRCRLPMRQRMLLRYNQHVLWQRMLLRCRQLNFSNESQICCKQYNFGSESQFRCRTCNSTANHKFAAGNSVSAANQKFATDNSTSAATPKFTAKHTFQQQMLIRCRQLNFSSESAIRCR